MEKSSWKIPPCSTKCHPGLACGDVGTETNHTSLLSLLVTEHQMRTTHLEHKTKQIFCTACLQPSQFSQALRGQMKYPRANCFQIISDHLLMAYAKRDKTEVQRSLFPAHHEVVLNPNIRSAMAVMRCCPGRDVQATALNFGHRGKKIPCQSVFFLLTFPQGLGTSPGTCLEVRGCCSWLETDGGGSCCLAACGTQGQHGVLGALPSGMRVCFQLLLQLVYKPQRASPPRQPQGQPVGTALSAQPSPSPK